MVTEALQIYARAHTLALARADGQVRKLTAERDELGRELDVLLGKKPTDLWLEDLDAFLVGLAASRVCRLQTSVTT